MTAIETTTAERGAPRLDPRNAEALGSLKGAPLSFQIAARMLRRLRFGTLNLTLPDGRLLQFEGAEPGPTAQMTVKDWRLARRIAAHGSIGFAEAYVDGMWDTNDLSTTLVFFSQNMDGLMPTLRGRGVLRFLDKAFHAFNRNTKRGSRRNIHAHYDLGNDFYSRWLDETMTYSAALFDDAAATLAEGQTRKYAALADSIGLTDADHVLEIGCGWGGFAEYAAGVRGAKVTAVTISQEQHTFASQRMFDKQLSDKVDIRLQDYRDIQGTFDGVASIEMFEAVGERYWPNFFDKVRDVLAPGGRAGLQIITIREDLFDSYQRKVDFIQRYIFPGGMLPSITRLRSEVSRAGLAWDGARMFARDYADTLKAWADRFNDTWSDIRTLNAKFDERFRRLWHYYLAYCEAGFRTGRIDVGQFALTRA